MFYKFADVSEESNTSISWILYTLTIKVKLSLCMSCRHTEGAEVQLHSFSTTALDRGERQTSNPGHFTPEENFGHTHNRRLGGPQGRYVPEFRVSTYVPEFRVSTYVPEFRVSTCVPEFRSRIVQPAAQSLHGVIAAGSIYHDDGHGTLSGYQIIM
jgi:hypothetical protein